MPALEDTTKSKNFNAKKKEKIFASNSRVMQMFVKSLQINEFLSCMFVSRLVVRLTIICDVVIDWLLALNTCSQVVWKSP